MCVGSLDRDPAFVARLRRRSVDVGLGDRVTFTGPRIGAELDRSYAAADLLVLPSRAEAYGMVVTEALARGLPVVAADVGGVTEALGHGADGIRPGLLVPPEDPAALGAALRRGSPTPNCATGCAGPPASGARRSRGWSTTTPLEVSSPERRDERGPRVSREWLALREPADAAARAPDLVENLGTSRRPAAR